MYKCFWLTIFTDYLQKFPATVKIYRWRCELIILKSKLKQRMQNSIEHN